MKFFTKPALLALSLPIVLTAFSSCSKSTSGSQQAPGTQQGATVKATVTALDGFWIEQNVPAGLTDSRGHALKTTSISIDKGKIFDVVKYADGSTDQYPAGISISGTADGTGSWVINGPGYVETISDRGNTIDISDVETYNGVSTTSRLMYVKSDAATAALHARQLWFTKTPSYTFATKYCESSLHLDSNTKMMVNQINKFVTSDLAKQGTSLAAVQKLRNTNGVTMNSCQITEDYLERGIEFAKTGLTTVFPEQATRPTLQISVDSKSSLAPIVALQLDQLALQADDQGASVVDLSPLSQMVGLESLTLQGLHVSGLDKLSVLSHLTDLTLNGMDLADYTVLKKMPALAGVHMDGDFSTSKLIPIVSSLAQIDSLSLSNTAADAEKIDVSSIAGLSGLMTLKLYGDFFTNLSFLYRLPNLTTLGVSLENDDSVNMIGAMTELKNVIIQKNVQSPDDMKFISEIPNIGELELTLSEGYSDLSTITSKNCPNLRKIKIIGEDENQSPLPDLTAAFKIATMKSATVSNFSISDLTPFDLFLTANSGAKVHLDSDSVATNQKSVDQNLQKQFGTRYQSDVSFR